ncbi:adenylate kinase [Sinomonas sp. JGH33]|uniref:Adenylate kinase n=1 Tax=Sinomonas terricola TaxID=3110330 RepID=A0ABU5T891_9MICC|nr:adenylate kinase [Sinomonas sp. JGH33]MEA5455813.1 adenylate kinase [Sinomonas sp. JGH33]
MNRILIMGPPGVGKGTQAERLAKMLNVPTISTGDLFREQVRNNTPLGVRIRGVLDSGGYVPDDVTNSLMEDRLARPDAHEGFILDGYPRTLDQVLALDHILARRSAELDAVVVLEADHAEIIDRMLARAAEQGRSDDSPEVINHRLEVYTTETAQLISAYDARGLVIRIDGMGLPHVVEQLIADALKGR